MASSIRARRKLAVFGGEPLFENPMYVIRPALPERALLDGYIDQLYQRRILTNQGPLAIEFERDLERRLGVQHALLVTSATLGLQMLARALGLTGEVIIPSFTFIASAHSLFWEGLTPVFADVDPLTLTLDVDRMENLVTEKTTAILGVHLFGNPCDIERLSAFAERHKLQLFFDAAQAFGSLYQGTPVGGFGKAEVFSLHATKILHTLEGGFITTNDSALYKKLVAMRNFGFSDYDKVVSLGINAKMSELNAAVGLGLLPEVGKYILLNRRHHERYGALLKDVPGVRLFSERPGCESNCNTYPIFIEEDFGLKRDQLSRILWAENIIARRYYYPGCHRQAPYWDAAKKFDLPVTESLSDQVLCLPCFPSLEDAQIEKIARIIGDCHERRHELKTV